MLQETVFQGKRVGLIRKGFYYLRTTRAIWGRVQVVERSRHTVRIFYTISRRRRRIRCVEDLPIQAIIDARRYTQ